MAADPDFLSKEALGVDPDLGGHRIWADFHPSHLNVVQKQPRREDLTVVTPHVWECFRRLPWGRFLKRVAPTQDDKTRNTTRKALGPVINRPLRLKRDRHGQVQRQDLRGRAITIGDVVCVPKDKKSKWRTSEELWFGYVQHIETNQAGKQLLHLLWLYQPSDTTCSTMHYPIVGELFLSDNCNCDEEKYEADEVIAIAPVAFFSQPGESGKEYFVRQKFYSNEASFLTIRESDFRCIHHSGGYKSDLEDAMENFQIGATVLVETKKDERYILEPMEITGFHQEGAAELVSCRQLPRKRYLGYQDAAANELIYTNQIQKVPAKDLIRKCHVRFYNAGDDIPPPYN